MNDICLVSARAAQEVSAAPSEEVDVLIGVCKAIMDEADQRGNSITFSVDGETSVTILSTLDKLHKQGYNVTLSGTDLLISW